MPWLTLPGTGLFGLAVSVWSFQSDPFWSEPFRSEPFRPGRFGLAHSIWPIRSGRFGLADSVWPIRSGRFGHGTFRSDYEFLQKSYSDAKASRLIQSALPPSSYCRLPNVGAFNSKRTLFTMRSSGKHCRQGILLGIKFLVV